MSYEQKIKAMGYTIEPVELDTGKIIQAVKVGNLVFTSGQVSSWGGNAIKGKIGRDLTVQQGYEAAKFCALNNLRALKTLIGSLDDVVKFVKILGMVNVAPDFDDTPGVVNGCSDFLREVFGKAGYHSRSAVGMTVPLGWAVEVDMVVEVK
jgi:enamine deaminase RidA (YjgF/YER057c/UK114 family)